MVSLLDHRDDELYEKNILPVGQALVAEVDWTKPLLPRLPASHHEVRCLLTTLQEQQHRVNQIHPPRQIQKDGGDARRQALTWWQVFPFFGS